MWQRALGGGELSDAEREGCRRGEGMDLNFRGGAKERCQRHLNTPRVAADEPVSAEATAVRTECRHPCRCCGLRRRPGGEVPHWMDLLIRNRCPDHQTRN